MSNLSKSSIVTITGGTGSFGSTMARNLIQKDVAEIRIFSRDENKQNNLRNELKDARVKFFIGDTRDLLSVEKAVKGADYVFHAAALKQVPSCEFFPMQASATNVNGSDNVINASCKYGVKGIVCLSTDKAVYPINAMGITKALMEKVAQSYARDNSNKDTKISITRYGNVMMSRGSVIPLFINQIIKREKITVTDTNMTRFMMSLSESVDLVTYALTNAESGDLFVKKAPGCTIQTIIEALTEIFKKKVEVQRIGVRHGEKMEESLLGSEERYRAIDSEDYFRVPVDARNLDYQIYFNKGQDSLPTSNSYTSSNTKQLSVKEVVDMISNLPEFIRYKTEI
jgi:UDP-N-acetylglucosamine 4,6-dehydratase